MTTHDDYLWDGSGEQDAEIASLERRLTPLRWQASDVNHSQQQSSPSVRRYVPPVTFRAAAALGLSVIGVWAASMLMRADAETGSMSVVALNGSPRIAGRMMGGDDAIGAGQWLETDGSSSARITVADHGNVTIGPESRVRLVRSKKNEQRLELARGSLRAFINAPPRLFIVDTPAATAFDLGCAYDMRVDDAGNGEIEVTLGWVSMENRGVKSLVPYGAKCLTRAGKGIGTPFYKDASPELVLALAVLDFGDQAEGMIDTIVQESTARDSLTLWHLLLRTQGDSRSRVLDRLVEIAPPPPGVTQERVLAGDRQAIDEWGETMTWSPNLVKARSR